MGKSERDPKVRFLIDIAYWAVIVGIIFVVFRYLLKMLMPFFLAFVFAALARPVSQFLSRETKTVRSEAGEMIVVRRRFRLNRTVSGIISVALLFLVAGGLLVLVSIRVADSAAAVISTVPDIYENSVVPGINRIYLWSLDVAARMDGSVKEYLTAAVPNLISSLGSAVTNFSARTVAWLTSLATKLPSILLNAMITMIATVFIAVDFDRIKNFLRRNLPEKAVRISANVRSSFLEMIWQFLKSYFIIFCVTAGEIALGMWIIGVSRPLVVGVVVAALDAFPIVGSGSVLVPWSIIELITGSIPRGLGILALYAVVTVIRQIIEPRIVGKRVGLRPVITLVCMYAGTRLFGPVGLFGLPIAAAIVADLNSRGIIHLFATGEEENIEKITEGTA
ncbi:MAG: sporulation integral membrane protein YtvI [Oscillospiraceae bacterium]|nr:sporulation integral membrane protein YtvI [Oscillospiraceae bacterium]